MRKRGETAGEWREGERASEGGRRRRRDGERGSASDIDKRDLAQTLTREDEKDTHTHTHAHTHTHTKHKHTRTHTKHKHTRTQTQHTNTQHTHTNTKHKHKHTHPFAHRIRCIQIEIGVKRVVKVQPSTVCESIACTRCRQKGGRGTYEVRPRCRALGRRRLSAEVTIRRWSSTCPRGACYTTRRPHAHTHTDTHIDAHIDAHAHTHTVHTHTHTHIHTHWSEHAHTHTVCI